MATKRSLFDYPNVIGHGRGYAITEGQLTRRIAHVVLVEKKVSVEALRPQEVIPPEWGSPDRAPLATDVIEVGRIRALQARTDTWRPAPGGVSIGHRDITAGTLGMVVTDLISQKRVILSNNHVLANSNAGQIGDPVYQPGPYDGGGPDDLIANLTAFAPIQFPEGPPSCGIASGLASAANALARLIHSSHRLKALAEPTGPNVIDAAIATPVDDEMVDDHILEITTRPTSVGHAILGMGLRKSGRTTGLTTGMVLAVDLTVDVDYGGKTARFERQFMAGPMSQGGDSGSVVIADGGVLVGLLFAGSDQTTIFNPIQDVFDALGLQL